MRIFVAVFLVLVLSTVGILVVLPAVSQALSGLLIGQTIGAATRMGEAIKPTTDTLRDYADTDLRVDAPERARKPVDARRTPERVRTPPRGETRSEKPRKASKQERAAPATPSRRDFDPRLADPQRPARFERRIDRGVELARPSRLEREGRRNLRDERQMRRMPRERHR